VVAEDVPDLWAALEYEASSLSGDVDDDNTPFTPDEQLVVAAQITEAKAYLLEVYAGSASDDQLAAINARLDYLTVAAQRMGRNDWRNAFTGALLGVLLQGLAPEAPVADVMRILLRSLAHLLEHRLGIPPTVEDTL
jgi:hypothetical protein